MGYTHYWHTEEWSEKDEEGYRKAVPIIRDIFERHQDIVRWELDSNAPAVVKPDELIHFNGIGEDGHETFLFKARRDQEEDVPTPNPTFAFCKTACKPYDIVVCEVLLVLNAHLPGLKITSDGFYETPPGSSKLDESWDQAIENVRRYGIHYHAELSREYEHDKKEFRPVLDGIETAGEKKKTA